MARIRTIKPEFFTSLTVASVSVEARLTFIGLWTHVDDTGRCVADGRLVKAAVWPLDDRTAADVEQDLKELASAGLIQRYEVSGRAYLHVCGWKDHQKISHPSQSKFPAPPNRPDQPPPIDSGPRSDDSEQVSPPVHEPSGNLPEDVRSLPVALPISSSLIRDQGSGIRERNRDHHQTREAPELIALIRGHTDATDDESLLLIEKIRTKYHPGNLGGYIRTAARNGDLAAIHLAELRGDRAKAALAAANRERLARLDEPDPPINATPEEAAQAVAAFRALMAGQKRGDPTPAFGNPGRRTA